MTTGTIRTVLICLVVAAVLAPALTAQIPTGTIQGRVTADDGQDLPGVVVSATSPALQGTRATTTAGNGAYNLSALPPGTYTLTYELEGFAAATREVRVLAAQTINSDIQMTLRSVAETITVTSRQETVSETRTGATTISLEDIEKLAVARTPVAMALLAPGISESGPGIGGPMISGAMSFENLWLLNGVVLNENVRGGPLPLFIEDAIQETTTAVSGISAVYGRFSGGVINTITKSGGNEFEGSLRSSLTNQKWEGETPLTGEREDSINEVYEGTLGGRFIRDRLWFFGAGRTRETEANATLQITGIDLAQTDEEDRFEVKLTGSVTPSHSLVGTYIEIDQARTNQFFTGAVNIDLGTVSPVRTDPQEIISGNYTGILTPSFFVEALYSEREFLIGVGSGGVQELIAGTNIIDIVNGWRYHAPTFCGGCETEQRSNENFRTQGSYFLTTDSVGSHDIVFGYDTFRDIRFSVNHQSGSDFSLNTLGTLIDANNNVYPVVNPVPFAGSATGTRIRWWPPVGLDIARPTKFDTNSIFLNDSWQLNEKWSFNLGVRYDENDGVDSGGNLVADDDSISPRLGASFDTKGDGDLVVHASAGRYTAAVANTRADATSQGGALAGYLVGYGGPAINTDPNCINRGDCVSSADALGIIFDWYFGMGFPNPFTSGADSLPADLSPEARAYILAVSIPGPSNVVPDTLRSPSADEITVGVSKRLGTKGSARADIVYRDWQNFYSNRNRPNHQIRVNNAQVDIQEFGNFGDDDLERTYTALNLQGRYRLNDRLSLAGFYGLSKLEGNITGETAGSGPVPESPGLFREYFDNAWSRPTGNLPGDQRHRGRVWAIYDVLRGGNHNLSASIMQIYESGSPYGAVGTVDTRPFVTNPGYALPPSTVTYFFTDRDAFTTDDITRTDLALNYSFGWNIGRRGMEVFLQPEVLNVFNEDAVIGVNTAVFSAANSGATSCSGARCQPFNPFTTTPVEGVHWAKGPNFGKPQGTTSFQAPRIFRVSLGFRF
jgi:hypothetical protein